jgi:hypothetical protein
MKMTRREVVVGGSSAVLGTLVAASCGRERIASGATPRDLVFTFSGFGTLAVDRDPQQPAPMAHSRRAYVVLTSNLDSPRHYPRLAIREELVKNPQGALRDKEKLIWNARDYAIEVIGAADTKGVTVATTGGPTIKQTCPASEEAWRSVSWLGNLERASGAGTIDPDCLSAEPPGVVAARAMFTSGEVYAIKPQSGGYASIVWDIRSAVETSTSRNVTQAIAEGVGARVPLSPTAGLRLVPFTGATVPQLDIEFRDDVKGEIAVLLENHSAHPVNPDPNHPVEHFGVYYNLLPEAQRPAKPPVPFAVSLNGCGPDKVIEGSSFCPSGIVFNPATFKT